MKNLKIFFTMIIFSVLFSIPAFANDKFEIYINGVSISIPENSGTVHIKDDSTMVPLRVFSENMGYNPTWNADDKSISIPYKTGNITLKINDNSYINQKGETISINTTPYIKDNITYIPLRAVADALGYKLEYMSEENIHTIILNNNISSQKDSYTVMIYMNGTNLESDMGNASKNIKQLLDAEIRDNVNVIIETGGTLRWQMPEINPDTNQRHIIRNNKLVTVEKNLGKKNMGDADTLSDFINYSQENYPADGYALIFWSHGWGSIQGFGYEEQFDFDTLTLEEMDKALSRTNTHFDFVGFDTCLMSTLEVANIFSKYSDYLIASEDLTPVAGWNYKRWLSELSKNPSMPTSELAKIICDDFYEQNEGSPNIFLEVTIATIDLKKMDDFQNQFLLLINELKEKSNSQEGFEYIKNARNQSKSYGNRGVDGGPIDATDAIDFIEKLNLSQSKPTSNILKEMIVYNRNEGENNNGISLYFPNIGTSIKSYVDLYSKSLFNSTYYDFLYQYIEKLSPQNK